MIRRRSEREVLLEAELITAHANETRLQLLLSLAVAENNRLKGDACAVAALGDARARSQTRHPANRTDDCPVHGIERPRWN